MSAELVLSRLSKVRVRGPEQWSAQCPAHEDRGPSLSVKETPDGRVLVHCFAGCSVDEVVGVLGLELTDLFPPREAARAPIKPRRLITAPQALELLHDEAQLIALCGSNIAHGVELSDDDRSRCLTAAGRIAVLRDEVMN